MTIDPDSIDQADSSKVTLSEDILGFVILYGSTSVGSMEAIPGQIEFIEIAPPWQGKGIARIAVKKLIELSREAGISQVTTNNTTHPAMDHILSTEGFEEREEVGWAKEL